MKYKLGDRVTIIADRSGHQFEVGSVVTITKIDEGDRHCSYAAEDKNEWEWWFGNNECVLYDTNNRSASWMLDKEY